MYVGPIRLLAAMMAATVIGSMLALPRPAQASEEGRRNTALGLAALSLQQLTRNKDKLPGILAGVGAFYAYQQWEDAIKARHRRESRIGSRRYYSRQKDYRTAYRREDRPVYRTYTSSSRYDRDSTPPGWSRGKKAGWGKGRVPPGWQKHRR